MKPLNEMTADTILSDEVLEEVFSQKDEIYKARLLLSLCDRAKELGVKQKFDELVKAFKKVEKEMRRKEREKPVTTLDNWTNFSGGRYDNMYCGPWIATDDGVFAQTFGGMEEVACYHPILPVERLKNLETGEEQIKIAYKRNGRWNDVVVPKVMITSASKIVALSSKGISVTSENAKLLVKYLADVENWNDDYIGIQQSTSKLGWIGNDFIPYDTEIVFDGDSRFKQVFESVSEHGSYDVWLDHVRELRADGGIEMKFLLAASFSSVLVYLLGGLLFFVDLWGETESGKTVSLMVAASVWADPDGSRYIGDFKTTDVALEARANLLNHLPMLLDDTSKTSARIRNNFEGVVYDLCSGKGKSRSNKELGISRENHWKNVIICNGERPLSDYVNQGGAINRILEIECGEKAYQNPQKTAETVKKNYGFAGKHFVEIVKELGIEKIREIQEEFQEELFDTDTHKMEKQSISLSIVLTADKIATDGIFKDGQYISIDDAKKALIDQNKLSDNKRCYQYLLDKVSMNANRFDMTSNCEKWGIIEGNYAIFYNQAFDDLCKQGGFSKKSFLSWAAKEGIVQRDSKGNPTKSKKIDGKNNRCVFLMLNDGIKTDENGFVSVEETQEELPFK